MFCPNCGIENPEIGRFCRSCGGNLSGVMAVVQGKSLVRSNEGVQNNAAQLVGTGICNSILGVGFLIISAAIYSIPGDTHVWLLMLFPAIALLASGIGRLVKGKSLEKNLRLGTLEIGQQIQSSEPYKKSLPDTPADYIEPSIKRSDNDGSVFLQPSVTEHTTRHLKNTFDRKTIELPNESK